MHVHGLCRSLEVITLNATFQPKMIKLNPFDEISKHSPYLTKCGRNLKIFRRYMRIERGTKECIIIFSGLIDLDLGR